MATCLLQSSFGYDHHKIRLKISGALRIRSIEPLVESEPVGLIWSVNEIEDFRNHEKIHKPFYINSFFRNGNFISREILIINIFPNINMVPEIFNLIDRPN